MDILSRMSRKMTHTNAFTIAHDHKHWLNTLETCKMNINESEQKLTSIAKKSEEKAFTKALEHHQNQLIIQKNNIDELEHKIHLHLDRYHNLSENQKQSEISILEKEHHTLFNAWNDLEKLINDRCRECREFIEANE